MASAAKNIIRRKKGSRSKVPWTEEKGIMKQIFWNLRRLRFSLVNTFYRFTGTNYGLLEAIFFPATIRYFLAYNAVTQRVLEEKLVFSVLEVGSGGPGISCFLDIARHRICLADIKRDHLEGYVKKGVDAAVVDGCKLPFRDNIYDVVVSIDTLEHIPRVLQKDFLRELKRVARRMVIISGPLTDDECMYKAREYIDEFERMHRKIHAHSDIPTMNELKEEFPDAVFEGLQNCDIRNLYTHIEYTPVRVFTGLVYLMFLKNRDYQPPYFSCLVTYDKARVPQQLHGPTG